MCHPLSPCTNVCDSILPQDDLPSCREREGQNRPSTKEPQKQRKETKAAQKQMPPSSPVCSSPSLLSSFHLLLAQALPSKSLPLKLIASTTAASPQFSSPRRRALRALPEAVGSLGGGGAPANARAPLRLFLVIIYYYYYLPLWRLLSGSIGAPYISPSV
jgi:hypothetical protein